MPDDVQRSTAAARPQIYFRPRSSRSRNFLLGLIPPVCLCLPPKKTTASAVCSRGLLDKRCTQLSRNSTLNRIITVTMADEAQDARLYNGNCHCGRYRFTVRVPEIRQMTACHCSLCLKQGYLWLVPEPGQFVETRADEGRQTEYQTSALRHKVRRLHCLTRPVPLLTPESVLQ